MRAALLGRSVRINSSLVDIAKLFSKLVVQIYTPSLRVLIVRYLQPLSIFSVFLILTIACGFNLHFCND